MLLKIPRWHWFQSILLNRYLIESDSIAVRFHSALPKFRQHCQGLLEHLKVDTATCQQCLWSKWGWPQDWPRIGQSKSGTQELTVTLKRPVVSGLEYLRVLGRGMSRQCHDNWIQLADDNGGPWKQLSPRLLPSKTFSISIARAYAPLAPEPPVDGIRSSTFALGLLDVWTLSGWGSRLSMLQMATHSAFLHWRACHVGAMLALNNFRTFFRPRENSLLCPRNKPFGEDSRAPSWSNDITKARGS